MWLPEYKQRVHAGRVVREQQDEQALTNVRQARRVQPGSS
jgi:hypothetical protein